MAASDMNKVLLIGRLTKDPELRQIPSGTSVASFSIASNKVYTVNNEKKEEVSFFNCVIWAKGAEIFAKYAKKGQQVAIDGRLQQRRWKDNDGNNRSVVEIVVENFQLLSSGNNSNGGQQNNSYPQQSSGGSQSQPQSPPPSDMFSDDEIPF